EDLARCRALGRVPSLSLNFGQMGAARAETLMASPHLAGLTALDLGNNSLGARGLRPVLAAHLPRLTALALDDNRLGDVGAQAVAAALALRRWRTLCLAGNDLGVAGVRALAASPHVAGVTSLDVSRNRAIAGAGVEALAASPYLKELRTLDLS